MVTYGNSFPTKFTQILETSVQARGWKGNFEHHHTDHWYHTQESHKHNTTHLEKIAASSHLTVSGQPIDLAPVSHSSCIPNRSMQCNLRKSLKMDFKLLRNQIKCTACIQTRDQILHCFIPRLSFQRTSEECKCTSASLTVSRPELQQSPLVLKSPSALGKKKV